MDSILCLVKSACLSSSLNLQDILLDATGQIKNYYKVLHCSTWPRASLPAHWCPWDRDTAVDTPGNHRDQDHQDWRKMLRKERKNHDTKGMLLNLRLLLSLLKLLTQAAGGAITSCKLQARQHKLLRFVLLWELPGCRGESSGGGVGDCVYGRDTAANWAAIGECLPTTVWVNTHLKTRKQAGCLGTSDRAHAAEKILMDIWHGNKQLNWKRNRTKTKETYNLYSVL